MSKFRLEVHHLAIAAALALFAAPTCPAEQVVDMSDAIATARSAVVHVENKSRSAQPIPSELVWPGVNKSSSHLSNDSIHSGILTSDEIVMTVFSKQPSKTATFVVESRAGERIEAKAVAYDAVTGCGLLKLSKPIEDAKPLRFAESVPQLGSPLAAVWMKNPGLAVAGQGIAASDVYWESSTQCQLFDTDILVQLGSMGGALVDEKGHLVGLILAMSSVDGRAGPAHCIPTSSLSRLRNFYGKTPMVVIHGGRLGVVLDSGSKRTPGRVVARTVKEKSPAKSAGIEPGDVFLAIGDTTVRRNDDMMRELSRYRAGDKVRIKVRRKSDDDSDKEVQVTVELAEAPVRSLASRSAFNSWTETPASVAVNRFQPIPQTTYVPQVPAQAYPTPRTYRPYVAQGVPYVPTIPATPPKIEVERSNLEESIRKLTKQMQELQKELQKIRK